MKRIFKVLDRHGNRHVAMARLHEDASELLFDPFIREARLTALLALALAMVLLCGLAVAQAFSEIV